MKVIGICGYSGSGKTTLLKQLISELKLQGLKIGVIKHSHHDMDIDIPGKDSYELRKSGAEQTIVACDQRWAMVHETPQNSVDLAVLLQQFYDIDLVLVEGFKEEAIPKIICHRQANHKPFYCDEYTIALVSDIAIKSTLPLFDPDNLDSLVNFIKHKALE